jgi:membrane associated rhomboid family serine protease
MLGWFWDFIEVPALLVLGLWFVTQLMNLGGSGGFHRGGGVAYWAHVGGFAAGVVLILLLGGRKLRKPDRRLYSRYGQDRVRPFRRWR